MADSTNDLAKTNSEAYTSKSENVRSFLCGQLNIEDINEFEQTIKQRSDKWELQVLDNGAYLRNCDFLYKGYVDSLYPNKAIKGSFYSALAEYKHTPGNGKCCFCTPKEDGSKSSIDFEVVEVVLCRMPHDVVLFYIKIAESNLSLNNVTDLHFHLREALRYNCLNCKTEGTEQKYRYFDNYFEAIEPLTDLCSRDNNGEIQFVDLVKNGNKLKLFQIVDARDYYQKVDELVAQDKGDRDLLINELLFEMATVNEVGVIKDTTDRNSPSKRYFDELTNDNIIEPFRNWKALAIFDTFTVICDSCDRRRFDFENWERYFRQIYLHVFYQKSVLFELNQDFRSAAIAETSLKKLVDKMKDHECYYGFSNISYNFQQQMIYEQILKGLKVEDERVQLRYYLERENERREQERERRELLQERNDRIAEKLAQKEREQEKERQSRKNRLFAIVLGFITFTSLASAINDATSLYIKLNDDNIHICKAQTFTLGLSIFTLIIIIGIWICWHFGLFDENNRKSQ